MLTRGDGGREESCAGEIPPDLHLAGVINERLVAYANCLGSGWTQMVDPSVVSGEDAELKYAGQVLYNVTANLGFIKCLIYIDLVQLDKVTHPCL
ncbi:hypothetical protein NPIL_625491 [Nephila pilipes]|uniref:Uncharacterized protein n=1 Tax=Nephila pilipes TaxID=299642 RepID=A0A8X6PRH6_NEPPI|nr:hypothetical protein NPIL_625491 [Nephila pilipes]